MDLEIKLILVNKTLLHLLQVNILVRGVLVLEEELEDLLLVGDVAGVEDGRGVSEESKSRQVPERVILC